ncbi:hypothetical protein SAMN05421504_101749 [Amycolatopsis xylanica]|uniref:Uncharacterized protein n=1 Tax=Amycolatopsis xylanica TaxID=589385 RepID=A0A1H2U0J3_9PSEU|nr:DUF6002 family protein [Amycolatopsis xylanica]SDW49742.1 hypothetical protein SAMN05421504_101749 [Amycolatopsis xylanica]
MHQLTAHARSTRSRVAGSTNVLIRYYEEITGAQPIPPGEGFEPGFAFPALDDRVAAFLEPATVTHHVLDEIAGVRLRLLDLRRNPATQTTKTLASLLLVARAVEHIRRTGEPILIFSPSSGNKAVALRDAVERALSNGLAEPHQLRIVTLTPASTTAKLRASRLSDDPELRRLNPVVVLRGSPPEAVKAIGAEFVREYRRGAQRAGQVWATLRLDNYQQADVVRAFTDHEFGATGPRVIHAHAVSSAYGLLGYQAGLDRLRATGADVDQPGYLLVQHLATCDMVLHSLFGDHDRARIPRYHLDKGLWRQHESPHFPATTWSPAETLEETFYTREPVTSAAMSGLIARHGGSGLAVSLHECLQRYAECRDLLRDTDITLPDDPRDLREWSLVMALTGVLTALDRDLVPNTDELVVHASGSYGVGDYTPLPPEHIVTVEDAAGLAATLGE